MVSILDKFATDMAATVDIRVEILHEISLKGRTN